MELRNRFADAIIFSAKVDTIKELVLIAIAEGADLSEANLSKADLRNVDMRWTKLNGNDLSRANLEDANLRRQPENLDGFVAKEEDDKLHPIGARQTLTRDHED